MITLAKGSKTQLPQGFSVGSVSDVTAATGCTVILCPQGAVASVAVYGGAPATRETDLLAPQNAVQAIHAAVLSGGSAYGLDAASGVARYLEEQKIGVPFSGAVVPIVVAASLFDLDVGKADVRPTAQMGYEAASSSDERIPETGNVGAGTGACVGRYMGSDHAMKGGLGAASVVSDELVVTALVGVNSLGSIYDREKGCYIAGAYLNEEGTKRIIEPVEVLPSILPLMAAQSSNTTIAAVLTNACLTKAEAQRVAGMSHDGMARAIYPSHTSFDGDAVFALATGEVASHPDLVGTLAALALEQAILDAVNAAEDAYGLLSASTLAQG